MFRQADERVGKGTPCVAVAARLWLMRTPAQASETRSWLRNRSLRIGLPATYPACSEQLRTYVVLSGDEFDTIL